MRDVPPSGYREPSREPSRRISYGPFAPAPMALAVVVLLAAIGPVLVLRSEVSSEVECRRAEGGAPIACVVTSRRADDSVSTVPAVLRRAGPSGNAPPAGAYIDELAYDGITLMLPNNPPGPLSGLLDSPDALHARTEERGGLGILLGFLALALAAFVLPLALVGVVPRVIVIDRATGVLRVGRLFGRGLEVPIDEIARVRLETFGDDWLGRLRGGRVVIEHVDGQVVPIVPFGRPPRFVHVRAARALAKALGRGEVISAADGGLRASPPMRGWMLAAQIGSAALAIACSIAWSLR